MISHREKMLIHIYAQAAGLSRGAYLDLLREKTGCASSADRAFSHSDCDRLLAAIETVLWDRVHRGIIDDPRAAGHQWVRDEFHFRSRNPGRGIINSRQAHLIHQLWADLCCWLPVEEKTDSYLSGIIRRATGRDNLGMSALTSDDAAAVIDALRDRLAYAIRAPAEEVPF